MKARFLFSSVVAAVAAMGIISFAQPGSAVVTIDHATTAPSTTIGVGETIQVTVRATWNGAPGLFGVFSSTTYDSAVLELVSAVSGANFFRGSLFAGFDPDSNPTSLSRFGQNLLRQPGDPLSIIRTVQYGSLTPIDPSGAATGQLVTTLTFKGLANGSTTIQSTEALGDTGAQGDTDGVGTTVTITVPEPGAVMAGMMALGTVAGVVAIRRRI